MSTDSTQPTAAGSGAPAAAAPAEPRKAYREMSIRVDHAALAARRAGAAAARAEPGASAADAAAGDDLIPVAISSESPVLRYDWWEGERFYEVLDHAPEAVDLSYARDGLPYLLEHNRGDQHGIIESVTVGADRVLRGEIRFSKAARSQEIKQDIVDGIRKKVSVGYKLSDTYEQTGGEKEGDVPTRRYKGWMPMECSSVSIPADYEVGYGRSGAEGAPSPEELKAALAVVRSGRSSTTPSAPASTTSSTSTTPAPAARSITVSEQNTAATNGAANGSTPPVQISVGDAREQGRKAEMERQSELRTIAARIKNSQGEESLSRWIEQGVTPDAAAREALTLITSEADERKVAGTPKVQLTDKERKRYNWQSAIRSMVDGIDNPSRAAKESSFEREISQDLEKSLPKNFERRGGLLVPTFTERETALEAQYGLQHGMLGRAGLDSATSTKGPELKFTVPGEFLPILRNFMALTQAGASILAGLQGPVAFPNQNGAGSAAWVAENSGSDAADSNLTLQQIPLNPKSLISSTSYSRQLIAQSVIDVDGMVRQDLAAVMALALDLAGINGPGTNAPTGILNTSGIGSVAIGTNGGVPTYDHLVDLETAIAEANADQWPLTYLTTPRVRGRYKKTQLLSNAAGVPVWQPGGGAGAVSPVQVQGASARVKGELNGYDAYATAQVPSTLTKGTASGVCHAILFGAFSQVVIGDWGMMELIVDPYRLKKQGMIELTAFAMYGIAVKYAGAFAAVKDATP